MNRWIADRVNAVPPSGIRRFFDIAATMEDVISLGIGEPDFATPAPFIEAAVRALREGHTHYTSNSGLLELREAIAEKLEALYGLRYDPETEILVTTGASEALNILMLALVNPGDEWLIPEPTFVSYGPLMTFAGGRPVYVPTRMEEDFQVTVADLEAHRTERTRGVLLCSPNNPTGAVIGRERMAEIARWAREKDLLVIQDQIYARLVYGVEHACIAAEPEMKERTVLVDGFSKAYAMTGWRLGFIAGPAEVVGAARKIHQYAMMSAPTPSQYAALAALREGEAEVERMRAEYDRRRRLIVNGLNELGLKTFEPQGAFYCFPYIGETGMTDEEFAERLLLEEKVAVVPGSAFGPSGRAFVRACYATAYEQIEEALERIARFLQKVRV